jgi:hypothetical protein
MCSFIVIVALASLAQAQELTENANSTNKLVNHLLDNLAGRVFKSWNYDPQSWTVDYDPQYTDLDHTTIAKPANRFVSESRAHAQVPMQRPPSLVSTRKPPKSAFPRGISQNLPSGRSSSLSIVPYSPLRSKLAVTGSSARLYGMPPEVKGFQKPANSYSPPTSVIKGPSGRAYRVPFVTGPSGRVYGVPTHQEEWQELPYEEERALMELIESHQE